MFKIAVVDDEESQKTMFCEYLERYAAESPYPFKTVFFSDGEDLVARLPADFDIIFLDIKMERMDGMTTAQKIREIDGNVIIIFVTNMSQYAIKGYSVRAFNFLLKPVGYFAFSEELHRSFERLRHKQPVDITVRAFGGVMRLNTSEILYIEVLKHKIIIHTDDGTVEEYSSMKKVEKTLERYSFARCNNCYLVNLARVKGIIDGYCLIGTDRLLISRPKKKQFMDALTVFWGEM